jgi:hypothetical protein
VPFAHDFCTFEQRHARESGQNKGEERVTGFEPANACLGIGRLSDRPHPLLFPDSLP